MSGFNNSKYSSGGSGSNKRGITFTAVAGAVLLIIVALICLSIIGCSSRNRKSGKVEKGKTVLTVDGEPIYENQFRFFASLVLNQEGTVYTLLLEDEIDANATVKNSVVNFAKEYIYRLRESTNAGVTLTDEEKQQVLDSIKNEYEQFRTVGEETFEGDSFYDHYYGLTEKQYTDFWLDWALIEKYNSIQEAQADVSEENQRAAYAYFEKYLYGKDIKVLSMSLAGVSSEKKEMILTLARELSAQIESGADMSALIQKHCDDEALKESDGDITVTSIMQSSFPELYEWAAGAEDGNVDVIVSEKAVYVAKAIKTHDFEAMKNSASMIEWTRLYAVDRIIEETVASGKYDFKINDGVYNAIDLSDLINDALKTWRSYYASLEAGNP